MTSRYCFLIWILSSQISQALNRDTAFIYYCFLSLTLIKDFPSVDSFFAHFESNFSSIFLKFIFLSWQANESMAIESSNRSPSPMSIRQNPNPNPNFSNSRNHAEKRGDTSVRRSASGSPFSKPSVVAHPIPWSFSSKTTSGNCPAPAGLSLLNCISFTDCFSIFFCLIWLWKSIITWTVPWFN